ncbi:OmpA family protein [Azospirillum sp. SYSU D00513]|uniref:OmpA family protein n=1 Tax=Azospirillum sp. SYSU D00513 TaxID=2812561 RepID=UPI001A969293|nr:OmpA family protein [Azospirillum sp. SYSU D00513]
MVGLQRFRQGVAVAVTTCLFLPGLAPPGPGFAQTAVPLGPNPSECEIQAALLGAAGPGCPPVTLRRPPPEPPAPPAPPAPRPAQAARPAGAAPPEPAAVPAPSPAPVPVPPPAPVPAAAPPAALPPRPAAPALRASFRIGFALDSDRITADSRAVLDRVGAVMAAPGAEGVRFRILGHSDARGGDAHNDDLSRRRAEAVAAYLVERHGIAPSRLETAGMGSREPLDPADPRAAANRRVEIVNLGE